MGRPSNREKILVATESVAMELGAAHLTLEAVASKAKMSKGGLLYHFKDKDALLEALLTRYVDTCMEQRRKDAQRLGGDATAMLKAYLLNMWGERSTPPRLHNAILAAGAANPRLLDSVRNIGNSAMETFRQSFVNIDEVLSLVLAAKGMMLTDLMQAQPFTNEEREKVKDLLMRQADALAKKPGTEGKPVTF